MMIGTLRLALSGAAAILCFVAGHQMRAQGSGVNFSFGLLSYAAGLGLLAYGVGGLQGMLAENTRHDDLEG